MSKPVTDWITLSDAASILASSNIRISKSTLARWAAEGRLQSVRPGRRIYVRRTQIRSMLYPRRGAQAWDVDGPPDEMQDGLFDDLDG
jgi:excisionase family DNA binding protein